VRLGIVADTDFVRAAFIMILGVSPTSAEIKACEESLAEFRSAAGKPADAAKRARQRLVHALLNNNDFVTIR
jgi:hypothetical protein